MGQPRFLIVSRPAVRSVSALGDIRRSETVWQLVGANNRSLGRSHGSFGDVPSCQAAIRRMVSGLPQCRPSLQLVEHGRLWTWRLELDDQVLAVSARSYRRQRECQYNLEGFLNAAHTGEPARERSGSPQPRPWRGSL
ncbi:hypothetical protein ACFYNO_16135 [Kitasatospora sp. NPDC006697]|uniref:hypothetical protein n=1 Tax=Kitasatospora sp. NPDC006697 TaxID=3364020 RepID=UPI0036CBA878